MELRGGAGGGTEYVAVAFGTVNRMQDADLYFCTGTTLRSGVIQRFRRPPRIFRALPVSNLVNNESDFDIIVFMLTRSVASLT